MSCPRPSSQPLVPLGRSQTSQPVALEVPAIATPGMRLRRESFGTSVEFFAPGLKRWQTAEWRPEKAHRFVPISVTGTACALQCDHCGTKVLEGMITAANGDRLFEVAARLRQRGTDGILVSGGSTRSGEVPLAPHLDDMHRIKSELGMRVIVHSGVVSADLATALAAARVDAVMLDVIGADETIRDVCHLALTASDFERSLALLAAAELRVIPHIVLGLHYGRFRGEHNALEMIRRYPVSTLVLVVMTPLVDTPMAHLEPPPLAETAEFFAHARQEMPTTPINLGCGRPMGRRKLALDKAALDHGLNGVAYPAEGIIDYAERCGLQPEYYEYCCSLTWTK